MVLSWKDIEWLCCIYVLFNLMKLEMLKAEKINVFNPTYLEKDLSDSLVGIHIVQVQYDLYYGD